MRIGIVTDVHDEVEKLAGALAALRAENVDAIVSLGDATDLFGGWGCADEVAALLRGAGVLGVWGNHDHGLCRDVGEKARSRASPAALDYMATVCGRRELGGCHFSHVEPWLDPEDPANLWTFEGKPEDPDRLRNSFSAVPHRAAFIGHFHRWLAATESGPLPWDGTAPLPFETDRRYLVVVGPLFRGDFAVIDTDRWTLEPRHLT
jgi:predicted phosphodiesterase